jgi:hypothetical protein
MAGSSESARLLRPPLSQSWGQAHVHHPNGDTASPPRPDAIDNPPLRDPRPWPQVWCNTSTGERVEGPMAVCEKCDTRFLDEDVR